MKLILPAQIRDRLAPQLPPDTSPVWVDSEGKIEGNPADAQAYFRWWTGRSILEGVLAAAPHVRWLHTPSAGVDHLLIPALLERNLVLTNSAGVHAIPIAEFVLALILNRAKKLADFGQAQAESRWAREIEPEELFERTMLILGIGGIGQAIAERARGFGMRIYGSRRTPKPMDGVDKVVGQYGWRELLPEADYVVIATPLTDETRGMLDAAAFAAMKSSAYLINIARGPIIDEPALVDALRAGRIAGAALDAFEPEPLPADSSLWSAPNVTITPHITAHSPRMRERQIALFLENLRRFRNDEPLLNVVDVAAGY